MYNEQENIKKCINVLKSQNNQKFDAIFIDDGSTDKTLEKTREYLKDGVFFNCKVVEQRNKGAAQARKLGIENTNTDFVIFLDCDDSFSENMIDEFYKKYQEYPDIDIVMPEMLVENKNKIWNKFCFYTSDNKLDSVDCIINSLNGWRVHGCFAIRKVVISKSYIDYERYNNDNKNYINNDEIITRLNFLNSRKIIRISAIYYYHYNISSTTKKVNNNNYLMLKNAFILHNIFIDNKKISPIAKDNIVYVIWSTFSYMRKNEKEIKNKNLWKESITESMNKISYFGLFSKIKLTRKIRLIFFKLTNLF